MSVYKSVNLTQLRYLSYKKLVSWYSGLVKPKPEEAPYNHIVQIGDPVLRIAADEIPLHLIKSPEVKFLITRMKKVMKKYNSVGLSATQIGIPVRLILLEFNKKHMKSYTLQEQKAREMEVLPLKVVINPEMKITDYTKVIFTENCESVKGFHAEVPRYRAVKLTGYGEEGETIHMESVGWISRIIQHELDHTTGKLYTDIMDRKSLTCSCWHVINERGGKIELPYGAQ